MEILSIVLIVALIIMTCVAGYILYLYKKTEEAHRKINREIDENQKANYEISQALAEKMQETEKQSRELAEASTELKWQTDTALQLYDEVEKKNMEITESIEYAKKIQSILLPEESFINEILNDYFVLFLPRDIVSGDFYWVNAKGNKTIVVVADCTGHGVPGAFMSLLGITFLNSIVKDEKKLQADIILNQMRDDVIRSLRQRGESLENKDGMDMAVCIIDWENARIEYAGANIPLILLRSVPESPHELIEIRADRMPVGLFGTTDLKPFTRHHIPIMPGDSIYMFSDGYCDQDGGAHLKKYMKKNLLKFLSEIHTLSMSEQKKSVKKNLEDWMGDLSQRDDILMVGIKI